MTPRHGHLDVAIVVTSRAGKHVPTEERDTDYAGAVAFLRGRARQIAVEHKVRMCRMCGCTDLSACDPPCSWVAPELCSSHGGAL